MTDSSYYIFIAIKREYGNICVNKEFSTPLEVKICKELQLPMSAEDKELYERYDIRISDERCL